MSDSRRVLITGGAGFIGSHVVRCFLNHYPGYRVINMDALTYAGNLENLKDVEHMEMYTFVHGDITKEDDVKSVFEDFGVTDIIHLAAESHVDRSIQDPSSFLKTNIFGTYVLLQQARKSWAGDYDNHLFYHVSTDEVYGSLGAEGKFVETTPYDPKSPYSASKASSDHFVRAYRNTYGLRTVISNCSNNYGPYQFPEKLIPLMINNIRQRRSLPVYGDGLQVRDWLYVEDHAGAIDMIFHQGKSGETYNVGGNEEIANLRMVEILCDMVDERLGRTVGTGRQLIKFVKDRPGHDRRYAIDCSKLMKQLGWAPKMTLETGLSRTIDWYLGNAEWLDHVTSGAYRQYYEKQYS